ITITREVVKAAAGNRGNGEEKVTGLLLDRRGDEISIIEQVVKAAELCGQTQVLDFSSQKTVRIEEKWRTIAHVYTAAKAGDVQAIEQLIQEGVKPLTNRTNVDVNSRSIAGRSPLFWPVSRGDELIVVTLMDAGADPTIMDCNGNTAITMARKNRHESIAEMLEGWNDMIGTLPLA
ncbi:hypothetical protein BDP81DRAFT_311927, partial [Colletotrichum phormii]